MMFINFFISLNLVALSNTSIVPPVVISNPASLSYSLKCRGGDMRVVGFQLYGNGDNQLVVGFKKGSKPANSGLNPGECSWFDRGMRSEEPSNLCKKVNDVFISSVGITDGSYNPQHFFMLQSSWSRDATYLDKVNKPDQYFILSVHSDGSTCLLVDKIY